MERYYELLAETCVADEEESKRLAKLNQAAEVAHERARVASGALDAFDEKVTLGTCGQCTAARSALMVLEYRQCELSRAAERNLRLYLYDIRAARELRFEELQVEHDEHARDHGREDHEADDE